MSTTSTNYLNNMKIITFNLFAALIFGTASLSTSPQASAQSKEQINAAKKLQADAMNKAGLKTTDALPDFIKKLKGITIGTDTEDDVVSKIGEPSSKNVLFGKKVWRYEFMSSGEQLGGVVCMIEYDLNQKVANIAVTKAGMGGVEMLYSQGTPQLGPNAVPPAASNGDTLSKASPEPTAPSSPKEGQIFFNSTDKHFYGWNGTDWKQLD
jgi:hypothetical protein